MKDEKRPPRMFLVAMRKDGPGAKASCVDGSDGGAMDRRLVREFYRDYAGHEIRRVDGDEMKRLMTI